MKTLRRRSRSLRTPPITTETRVVARLARASSPMVALAVFRDSFT